MRPQFVGHGITLGDQHLAQIVVEKCAGTTVVGDSQQLHWKVGNVHREGAAIIKYTLDIYYLLILAIKFVYSLQSRQRRPPLGRKQQNKSMHQLIAERIGSMI